MLLLQPFQKEFLDIIVNLLFLLALLFLFDSNRNIFFYRHIGKQRIFLKQISDFSLTRRKIDPLLGIKQFPSI